MTREEAMHIVDIAFDIPQAVRRAGEDRTYYKKEIREAKDMAIKVLEQTRWIPVSEKLPEVGSEVLVCYDFKGKRSVYIANFYGDGEFHGFDDEYLTSEGRKYRKAIAWMPLPQPYKAESEDNE